MNLPVSTSGVLLEKTTALLDSKWSIDEYGDTIIFYDREETNITRDKYNSIKRKNEIVSGVTMGVFPQHNPNTKQIEKAGLREVVDLIVTTAMQDWINNSIDPEIIDMTRASVVYKSRSFKIKDVGFVNAFSDTYLNVTLGLIKN